MILAAGQALAAPAIEAPPASIAIDGDLREWTTAPLIVIDEGSSLRGFEPPRGPEDLSARVWVAFHPDQGLYIAADVRDDAAKLCGIDAPAARVVRSDHLELRLTFGDPPLPPVGWGVGIGENILESQASCEPFSAFDCRAWYAEQITLRESITALFRPQFLLSESGVQPVLKGEPVQAVGKSKVAVSPSGWTLEALLPIQALPPSPVEPIAEARLLVEITDNDLGWEKQESFLSSSPSRLLSDPSSWRTLPLSLPSKDRHPSGLAARLLGRDGWWRQADPQAAALHRYLNFDRGYQWEPAKTSPISWDLTLPQAPTYTVGGTGIWALGSEAQDVLFAARDGRSVGFFALRWRNRFALAEAKDRGVILAARKTSLGELGPRPGSAAEVIVLRAFHIDASGQLVEGLHAEEEQEGPWQVDLGTDPAGALAGLRLAQPVGEDVLEEERWSVTWRWTGSSFERSEVTAATSWRTLIAEP